MENGKFKVICLLCVGGLLTSTISAVSAVNYNTVVASAVLYFSSWIGIFYVFSRNIKKSKKL